MEPTDPDPYRYGEHDCRPFFLNSDHYLQALKAITDFGKRHSSDQPLQANQTGPDVQVPREVIRVAEENRRLPIDGYFSFFSDLLGFSSEVARGGMDSLPDFYGGALVAADMNPKVKVYLLSDSCLAFAPVNEGPQFIQFVSTIISRWLLNGLIPQSAIGYGSFVERNPFSDIKPANFFGIQVTGTALANATDSLKANKPFGSRIFLTADAWSHWPSDHVGLIGVDGNGKREFFLDRTSQQCLFDCVYYLLCLREHEQDSRAFKHYTWSFASRAVRGRVGIPQLAAKLAAPYYRDVDSDVDLETIMCKIDEVLKQYESAKLEA